jgi:hypothetical protein
MALEAVMEEVGAPSCASLQVLLDCRLGAGRLAEFGNLNRALHKLSNNASGRIRGLQTSSSRALQRLRPSRMVPKWTKAIRDRERYLRAALTSSPPRSLRRWL